MLCVCMFVVYYNCWTKYQVTNSKTMFTLLFTLLYFTFHLITLLLVVVVVMHLTVRLKKYNVNQVKERKLRCPTMQVTTGFNVQKCLKWKKNATRKWRWHLFVFNWSFMTSNREKRESKISLLFFFFLFHFTVHSPICSNSPIIHSYILNKKSGQSFGKYIRSNNLL